MIDPYKNLPSIAIRDNKMIPTFSKRAATKSKVKLRRKAGLLKQNTNNTDLEELKSSFTSIKHMLNDTHMEKEPEVSEVKEKVDSATEQKKEQCIYSVVDLLQRPAIASEYIPNRAGRPRVSSMFWIE